MIIPVAIFFGGIFLALVLGLFLSPIIGPTFISKNENYVIQRPYQGFLGSASNLELVERYYIFEKRIKRVQVNQEIHNFEYDILNQKLFLNNKTKQINLNTIKEWR